MSSYSGGTDIQSVRAWRKDSQRAVRSCFATLDSALSKWDAARAKGLQAATSLVNCHLNVRFMSNRDLGVLSDLKDIRPLAAAKLYRQQVAFEIELGSAFDMLVSILRTAETAVASLRPSPSTAGATDLPPATSPRTPATSAGGVATSACVEGLAVFFSLPMEAFDQWANEILCMWQKEVVLKSTLRTSLSSLILPPRKGTGVGGGKEVGKKEGEEPLPTEAQLQVYLTLWLADVHVDKARMKELIFAARQEMEGF